MGKEKLHGLTAKKIRKLFKIKKYPDGRYDLIHADSATILVRRSLCVGPNLFKIGDVYYRSSRLVYTYFFGEIPYNHCIRFKDEDSSNFDPSNFLCTNRRSKGRGKIKKEETVFGKPLADLLNDEEEILDMEKTTYHKNSLEIVHKEEQRQILQIGDIFSYNGSVYILSQDGMCVDLSTGIQIDLRLLFDVDDEREATIRDYKIHKNPKLVL